MKYIYQFFVLLICFAGLTSCEDESKAPYLHAPDLERGAYFRNISNGGIFNRNDNFEASNYSITGELVAEDADEVSTIDLMVAFVDNTTDGDPDTEDDESISAVLLESSSVSTFSLNSNGFLEKTFDIAAADVFTTLNLDPTIVEGGDQIIFETNIVLKNGTVFNSVNTGDSVRGELFFSSPLDYSSTVVCLSAPKPGDWILDMQDAYDDGWNGGLITVNMDGVITTYSVESGSSQTEIISVPEDTYIFTWTYTSGQWEDENTYTLTDPDDEIVLDEGPFPTTGELLNKCL